MKRLRRAIAVVVLGAATVSCGSSSSLATSRAAAGSGRDLLELAAQTSIGGAEVPGGGFAVFGVSQTDGRVSPDGAVFDKEGRTTASFRLPDRTAVTTSVIVGTDLFILGVSCDDAPKVDDIGDRHCAPGTDVGYRVDLTTASVQPIGLPVRSAAEEVVPGSWALFTAGERPFLLANRAGSTTTSTLASGEPAAGPGFLAWQRVGSAWVSVAPPDGVMCQAGATIIDDVTKRVDNTSHDPSGVPGDEQSLQPAVRVFDPVDRTWSKVALGPTMVGAARSSGTGCTSGWMSFFGVTADAEGKPGRPSAVSFDALDMAWSERRSLGSEIALNAPITFSGTSSVLLKQPIAGTWVSFDPKTGHLKPILKGLDKEALVVSASQGSALVFDPRRAVLSSRKLN